MSVEIIIDGETCFKCMSKPADKDCWPLCTDCDSKLAASFITVDVVTDDASAESTDTQTIVDDQVDCQCPTCTQ